MAAPLTVVHVAIAFDSDPIRGTVTAAGQAAAAFTGWIELTQLLERAHQHDPCPSRSKETP
jgi:hypothetical protein